MLPHRGRKKSQLGSANVLWALITCQTQCWVEGPKVGKARNHCPWATYHLAWDKHSSVHSSSPGHWELWPVASCPPPRCVQDFNTAMLFNLHVTYGCLRAMMAEYHMWSLAAKPKVFTIWPFIGKKTNKEKKKPRHSCWPAPTSPSAQERYMHLTVLVPALFQINKIITMLSQKRPQDKSLYPFLHHPRMTLPSSWLLPTPAQYFLYGVQGIFNPAFPCPFQIIICLLKANSSVQQACDILHLSTRGRPDTAHERWRRCAASSGRAGGVTISLHELLHRQHMPQRWQDLEE